MLATEMKVEVKDKNVLQAPTSNIYILVRESNTVSGSNVTPQLSCDWTECDNTPLSFQWIKSNTLLFPVSYLVLDTSTL